MTLRLRCVIGLGAALLMATSPVVAQQQVRVVGTSTADAVVIKDTLQTILQFSYSRDGCQSIGEVIPKVLKGYAPEQESYRTDEPDVIYERWDVELCENRETFLISFWPADEGGTMFKISYPPPADLPASNSDQDTNSSIGT